MKSVRTVNGVTRIGDAIQEDLLVEILNAHRDTLIKRILVNLDVYLSYRFNLKPSKEKMDNIKDALISMKSGSIDRNRHAALFTEIKAKDHLYVGTAKFYEDIDEGISWKLK